MTYQQSKDAAEADGGHLVTMADAAENEFVRQIIQGYDFLGPGYHGPWLGALYTDGVWTWTTGESFDFSNWASGQPDNLGSQNWAVIGPEGFWGNESADTAFNPVWLGIEWDADCNNDGIVDYGQILDGTFDDDDGNGVPDCCDSGSYCVKNARQWRVEDGGNGHWYEYRLGDRMTYQQSKDAAEADGGHLVTMADAAENEFVRQIIQGYDFLGPGYHGPWLGALYTDGVWTWTTGESFDFSNWASGQPDNLGSQNWAVIGPEGFWGNESADTAFNPVWLGIEWDADCNNDGIVDYGQILDGIFDDDDGNGVPDTCETPPCPGDITGNGQVDAADLGILLAVWNTNGKSNPAADINSDGTVNAADLGLLIANWGPCPE